jgi:hypothetical protein
MFVDSLNPTYEEKTGLTAILSEIDEPIIMEDPTPNKVLLRFWDTHGKIAIRSIIKDETLVEKLYSMNESPAQILKEVQLKSKEIAIISSLPKYKNLPSIAKFVDFVARTYKTRTPEETIRVIEKYDKKDMKIRSISYGFLLALNSAYSRKWQYSKEEIEFGEFLEKYAYELLNASPNEYHEKFQTLLTVSGVNEDITTSKI